MLTSRLTRGIVIVTLFAAVVALWEDDAPAALTLIGALVLAVVAAETAEARQLRQIEADAERQTRALEAERERHLATLAHDRDLADLRALLDEAAVALHRGDQAIGGVKAAYIQHGRSMHEHQPDAGRELNLAGRELDMLGARLSVRLGGAQDAVQAFRAATDAALDVSHQVGWLEDDRPEDARRKHAAIDTSRDSFTAAARRFVVVAVELAGTRQLERSARTESGRPGTDGA